MKKFITNAVAVIALILVSVSIKAQPVVTEYFAMKEPFKIDLANNKVHKAAHNYKGLIDLDWNEAKRTLAVSYDPKVANAKDIVNHVKEVASGNMTASTAGGFAKNEKEEKE